MVDRIRMKRWKRGNQECMRTLLLISMHTKFHIFKQHFCCKKALNIIFLLTLFQISNYTFPFNPTLVFAQKSSKLLFFLTEIYFCENCCGKYRCLPINKIHTFGTFSRAKHHICENIYKNIGRKTNLNMQ